MLYLEDFLEVVEGIPNDVKSKTSEIRELDSHIHNTSQSLEDQLKTFYNNAKKMKSGERAASFEKIRRQYYKLLEDADEKVSISTNLHNSLERYVRRIDTEIEKFKFELEADSPGITEILERKSLELDEPSKENHKDIRSNLSRNSMTNYFSDWRQGSLSKKDDSDPNLSSNLSLSPNSSLSYNIGHIGASGNAIAAAASQAIAATQQMRHGRRTASLNASYEAISQGVAPSDLSIGSELANAAKAALAASSLMQDSSSNLGWASQDTLSLTPLARENSSVSQSSNSGAPPTKRQKKGNRSTAITKEPIIEEPSTEPVIDPFIESPDWTYDPNEPRYCICDQVSYGNMVACDNPKCTREWFHYNCVGITAPPKGKWFCPQCATTFNRRQKK